MPGGAEHLLAVHMVEMKQNLSICLTMDAVPLALQIGPKLSKIVDLAVEGQVEAATRIRHRLVVGWAERL